MIGADTRDDVVGKRSRRAFAPRIGGHLTDTSRSLVRARWAYLFILPSVVATVLFQLGPSVQAFAMSFFDARVRSSEFVGLMNYVALTNDPLARTAIKNTILFVAVTVPAIVVFSLVTAATLSYFHPRIQAFFRGAYYLPVVAGSVIMAITWRWIYNSAYGVLPQGLTALGIRPPLFLGDPSIAIWALAVIAIASGLGAPIIIFMASMAAIPTELRDASRVDGCDERQVFRHITLPLLRATILFVMVVATIAALQTWELVYLVTLGGPEYSTYTLGYFIYVVAFNNGAFGYASAAAVVLLILVLLVVGIQMRLLGFRR